ncbi:MAG: Na+/H+ antiporter NhaA [Gammaproteobacteria bacterium]
MNFSKRLQEFIKLEAGSGVVLLFVLAIALIIANSPLYSYYLAFIDLPIQIRVGTFNLEKSALLWVNEFLMAIFFMLLALEIKREIAEGELSNRSQLSLPVIAAVGGIAIPGLIYYVFNYGNSVTVLGWPIPTTTDIAFVLCVVALLGDRVPTNLKVFVVALSIVDDILAIIIIGAIYTSSLSIAALGLATAGILTLILLNRLGVKRVAPYMLIGIFIWVGVLESKIHATIAGVIIGMLIPLRTKDGTSYSPLRRLERMLHPWVAYFILPTFVFFNGGIPFKGFTISGLFLPVPLGIMLGLFVGKSIGVFTVSWLVIKSGLARLPSGSNWPQLFAVSTLTGIGFTMSLFLSALAFNGTLYEDTSRQGVIVGSILSTILGVSIFIIVGKKRRTKNHNHSAITEVPTKAESQS